MRMRSPASRGSFKLRFSVFDVIWAAISPILATYFRDTILFTPDRINVTLAYCLISFGFSLIAFLIFRIRDGMMDFFSVHDALDVAKAVLVSELLTIVIMFSITRLDGIPRSTPIIHALVLASGLVFARTLVRILKGDRKDTIWRHSAEPEHAIMIGSTKLTSLYIKMIEAYSPKDRRVIAILDDNPNLIGRSIEGRRIAGPPSHLEAIMHEFFDHGIRTDRIIVGGDRAMLSIDQIDRLKQICTDHELELEFVTDIVGFTSMQAQEPATLGRDSQQISDDYEVPTYFRVKRIADFIVGLILMIVLLPLFLIVAGLVLIDVGSPIFFWQQRIGFNGRTFLLHKFRSMKTSFDWHGFPVPESERLSLIGTMLRRTRLDELPQLLNVLVGDMSLIGPRPLLPRDQPSNPDLRLKVRPGITGWAQINGDTSLSATDKNELDEWYIRSASPWLDLKIFAKTVAFVLRGGRSHNPEATGNGPS